ncbi:MAG: hypothetical protein WCV62_04005 [Candidatus Peribacteraceae bacterium]|jgi:hypothetical protein
MHNGDIEMISERQSGEANPAVADRLLVVQGVAEATRALLGNRFDHAAIPPTTQPDPVMEGSWRY